MRKFAAMVAILRVAALLAGMALGSESGDTAILEMTMQLVSMDLEKNTIILKSLPNDRVLMVPVKGEALVSLKNKKVKEGDTVVATCQGDQSGYCMVVTRLVKA